MKIIKYITTTLIIFLFIIAQLHAQKLPGKQENSLRVSANVKIDGKLIEWGSKLQAYNKNTLINYSIANDDENLYLAIQINDVEIISKAISGAITLTVNNRNTKSDLSFPSVSFPLLDPASASNIRSNLKNKSLAADSLLIATDKELKSSAKAIKFSDINGITDTITGTHKDKLKEFRWYPLFVLPGYYLAKENSQGIKAAASFEGRWKYNYELSIPLKYLKVPPGKKFSYNIRLNGPMYKTNKPTSGYTVMYKIDHVNQTATREGSDLIEPTDFWGEYILAKKP